MGWLCLGEFQRCCYSHIHTQQLFSLNQSQFHLIPLESFKLKQHTLYTLFPSLTHLVHISAGSSLVVGHLKATGFPTLFRTASQTSSCHPVHVCVYSYSRFSTKMCPTCVHPYGHACMMRNSSRQALSIASIIQRGPLLCCLSRELTAALSNIADIFICLHITITMIAFLRTVFCSGGGILHRRLCDMNITYPVRSRENEQLYLRISALHGAGWSSHIFVNRDLCLSICKQFLLFLFYTKDNLQIPVLWYT